MRQVLEDTVYISGCSHSHHWYLNQDLANSWTTQLGFKTVYNHSICGSSNEFIARRAWMFCEKYKPELAIIQWTNLTRTEAIGHGAKTNQNEGWIQQLANTEDNKGKAQVYFLHNENLPLDNTQSPEYYYSTFYGPWNDDNNSKAFVQTWDFSTAFCNLIKNALVLQTYFKAINQPYIFVNGTDWLHTSNIDPDHLPIDEFGSWHPIKFLDLVPSKYGLSTVKPIADKIDRTRWLSVNIMSNIQDRGDDGSHGGIKTNKDFALQIKAWLDKVNAGNRK